MGVFHRKLFPSSNETIDVIKYPCLYCSPYCPSECKLNGGDDDDDDSFPSYPPLPPPVLPPPSPPPILSDQYQNPNPNQNQNPEQKHQVSPIVIIIIVILASCFLLVSYYAIIVKYCGSWRESRRRRRSAQNQPPEETHEDFIDENHGPIIDHPIWFITTVGLEQSIINAITVCKYKKGEGLIEGTECSVCLNEFHEDETLRLLPKCSHAFHLPCIDTWLRSHKNCPLCRAPIVANPVRATSTAAIVPISNSSDSTHSREETLVENSESDDGLEGNQELVSESRIGVEDERELQDSNRRDINITKEIVPCPPPNNGFRVLSDLADNHRTSAENGIQPVRRSVSMDLSMFCLSVPNSVPVEGGSSNAQPVVGKDSNSSIVPKTSSMSPSIFRLMGSSSIGGFLQRGPVSMKRSFSSGGKLSRSSRSQSSNLPL